MYPTARFALHDFHTPEYVLDRVDRLHQQWQGGMGDRNRIRGLLNGGRDAVYSLFGQNTRYAEPDLPAANFVDSGLERLAQKLGNVPDVKVDPPLGDDGPRKRYNADMIEQIVSCYDYQTRLELQLPQQARWLPGYGLCVWVMSQERDPWSGHWYPTARIRNAYDCFPSEWDADADPTELAVTKAVPVRTLAEKYPAFKAKWKDRGGAGTDRGGIVTAGASRWGNVNTDSVVISEYYDVTGCYYVCGETEQILDYWPNPLDVPPFVVARRFSFDKTQSHYTHVIGLQAMLAKLNILAFVATEDATFAPTNIIGDIMKTVYNRGRHAINHFPPGVTIEKGQVDSNVFQAWQQIDRLERHFRIGGNYPQASDGESPNSFATGQGISRLGIAFEDNVAEYQKALRWALQKVDALRLGWDERVYSGVEKPLYHPNAQSARTGTYDPARIKGWHHVRRVYGMMATWDEPQKIVGGLQLLAAKVIDVDTMQENLSGLNRTSQINERVLRRDTQEFLLQALAARAQQMDPMAMKALTEIYRNPEKVTDILAELFDPPQQEVDPLTALAGGAGPAPGAPGQPPDVTTILSRLESSGAIGTGAQTVAQI